MTRTTIDPQAQLITLINVFSVDPGRQRDLVALLDTATEEVMRHRPGFISANIHASTDGERVVNYAQWRSEEDFRAMLGDPVAREHMDAATRMADAEPKIYTIEATHHA